MVSLVVRRESTSCVLENNLFLASISFGENNVFPGEHKLSYTLRRQREEEEVLGKFLLPSYVYTGYILKTHVY